jgi:hypothetical protein
MGFEIVKAMQADGLDWGEVTGPLAGKTPTEQPFV